MNKTNVDLFYDAFAQNPEHRIFICYLTNNVAKLQQFSNECPLTPQPIELFHTQSHIKIQSNKLCARLQHAIPSPRHIAVHSEGAYERSPPGMLPICILFSMLHVRLRPVDYMSCGVHTLSTCVDTICEHYTKSGRQIPCTSVLSMPPQPGNQSMQTSFPYSLDANAILLFFVHGFLPDV